MWNSTLKQLWTFNHGVKAKVDKAQMITQLWQYDTMIMHSDLTIQKHPNEIPVTNYFSDQCICD